jgi:hypothetical protein
VALGWIPFRAPNVESAFALFGRLLDADSYASLAFRENTCLFVFCICAGMLALYGITRLQCGGRMGSLSRGVGEITALTATVFIVFIFLRPVAQFIYFQF